MGKLRFVLMEHKKGQRRGSQTAVMKERQMEKLMENENY